MHASTEFGVGNACLQLLTHAELGMLLYLNIVVAGSSASQKFRKNALPLCAYAVLSVPQWSATHHEGSGSLSSLLARSRKAHYGYLHLVLVLPSDQISTVEVRCQDRDQKRA